VNAHNILRRCLGSVQIRATFVILSVALSGCSTPDTFYTSGLGPGEVEMQQRLTETWVNRPHSVAYAREAAIRVVKNWQPYLRQYGRQLRDLPSVHLEVCLNADGQVESIQVLDPSQVNAFLDKLCRTAILKTKFDPFPEEMRAELNGYTRLDIPLTFVCQ
jgi:TonB family protein